MLMKLTLGVNLMKLLIVDFSYKILAYNFSKLTVCVYNFLAKENWPKIYFAFLVRGALFVYKSYAYRRYLKITCT